MDGKSSISEMKGKKKVGKAKATLLGFEGLPRAG